MSTTTKQENTDEISLKELVIQIRSLWRHLLARWPLLLAAGILGGALGFWYAHRKKVQYAAELTFALEEDRSSPVNGAFGLASQLGFDFGSGGGGVFAGDNLLELMRSRTMIKKALLTPVDFGGKRETLAERYIQYNKLREEWNDPGLQKVRFPPGTDTRKLSFRQDSLLREFHKEITSKNLNVDKKDKRFSIIAVDVTTPDELFSKYFAEVLVRQVANFYVETRTKKEVQNLGILQHQVDSVRRELNVAISGSAVSSDANPNPNMALQVLKVPSQRKQVDVQTNTAILAELVRNLEIAKVALRKETPLIQVIDTPDLPLPREGASRLLYLLLGAIIAVGLVGALVVIQRIFRSLLA